MQCSTFFRSSASASEYVENLHPNSNDTVNASVLQSSLKLLAQKSPNPDAFLSKYEDLKSKKYVLW